MVGERNTKFLSKALSKNLLAALAVAAAFGG